MTSDEEVRLKCLLLAIHINSAREIQPPNVSAFPPPRQTELPSANKIVTEAGMFLAFMRGDRKLPK